MPGDDDPQPLKVRCAIYTRQSVARDGDPAIASCKVQRAKCIEFIRSMAWRGWCVAGEHFDDEGQSGATTDRPSLAKLLRRIEDGEVHRVIVYRLDRLTRRLADWAKLAAVFERHDIGLTIVHGAIDPEAGSLQRFQLNMLATFAEMEREMIAERLADARRSRNARGERSSGRVPLGYVSDPRTRQLVIDRDEARVVRRLFRVAAGGSAPTAIALDANKRGLPNRRGERGTWSPRTILRILQNPVYVARRPDGTPAAHAAIIDAELAAKVAELIEGRRSRAPSKRTPIPVAKDPFLLRGLLACEACGKTMTPAMSKGKIARRFAAKSARYYRCRTTGCTTGHVAARTVESFVNQKLVAHKSTFEPAVHAKLRELRRLWDRLTPDNQRRALAETFTLAWRGRTSQLIVRLKDAGEGARDG